MINTLFVFIAMAQDPLDSFGLEQREFERHLLEARGECLESLDEFKGSMLGWATVVDTIFHLPSDHGGVPQLRELRDDFAWQARQAELRAIKAGSWRIYYSHALDELALRRANRPTDGAVFRASRIPGDPLPTVNFNPRYLGIHPSFPFADTLSLAFEDCFQFLFEEVHDD